MSILRGDEDGVTVRYDKRLHQQSTGSWLDQDVAHDPAALDRELRASNSLTNGIGSDAEDQLTVVIVDPTDRHELVIAAQVHSAHAAAVALRHADLLGGEPSAVAVGGRQEDVALAARQLDGAGDVALGRGLVEHEALRHAAVEVCHHDALDLAVHGGEHSLGVLRHRVLTDQQPLHQLAVLEAEVGRMATAPGGRDLVGFQPDHSAPVRHGKHAVVRVAPDHGLQDVVGLDLRPLLALRIAVLDTELVGRQALQVAAPGDADEAFLLDHQGAGVRVGREVGDRRAARASEALGSLIQLSLHLGDDVRLVGQQTEQVLDLGCQLGCLTLQLVAAQAGEPAQLHCQNGVGLLGGAGDQGAELDVGRLLILGVFDGLDHLVDLWDRRKQALHDVLAVAHPTQLGAGLATDALGAEVGPASDRLDEADRDRLAVGVQRGHVDGERGLQIGVAEELLQHDPGVFTLLQVDYQADLDLLGLAVLGGLVAEVFDLGDRRLAAGLRLRVALAQRRVGDAGQQRLGGQAERDRRDDDAVALPAGLGLLDVRDGAHLEDALAGGIRLGDVGGGPHQTAGRKVRAGHDLHQTGQARLLAFRHAAQHVLGSLRQLTGVVRRNLRGEADADRAAGNAVQQEHWDLDRHELGLGQATVVVRRMRDCAIIDAFQHEPVRRPVQLSFRLTGGCRARAVNRAMVAMTVN